MEPMLVAHLRAAAALSLGFVLGCSSEVTTGATGSGGAGQGGAPLGVTVGQGGASSGQGGAGGGPVCESFGDPCTGCAVMPGACEADYCGCLANEACSDFWFCVIGCPDGDAACVDACELGSPGGYADFMSVVDCLGTKCPVACNNVQPLGPCFSCWIDGCGAQLDGCVADVSCNEMIDCMGACSAPACFGDCYDAALDKTAADALFTCTQATCDGVCGAGTTCQGFGDACTDCAFAQSSCNGAYCGCYAIADCFDYGQCTQGCAGDATCQDTCELTYAPGFSAFYAMVSCMGGTCETDCGFGPIPDCLTCLVTTCASETDACEGDAECNEYLDCTQACTDLLCNTQCYAAMTDTTEADGFLTCLLGPCDGSCASGASSSSSTGGPGPVGPAVSVVSSVGVGPGPMSGSGP